MANALKQMTAVVTGASAGIGNAIARSLAREGATVCLVSRNPAALALPSGKQLSTRTFRVAADLAREKDIQKAALFIKRKVGSVDILVHCAGKYGRGDMARTPIRDLDTLFRTNVRGPYLLTQLLLPLLKASRGQVVFMNSSKGLKAGGNVGQYSATHHAMRAVADSLRDEVNQYGVRVLSVFPGRTATSMMQSIYASEGKPYDPGVLLQPEDIAAVVLNALALPRTAEVTDVFIRPMMKTY
jgi:NADP-dependent 3-hydroxy acid dehydrogenase YdfG